MSHSSQQQLIALSPEKLRVGMALRFTLLDEQGRVLLAKGLRIESRHTLESLRARPAVYVEYQESDEAVQALMSGLAELSRIDAPIKYIGQYALQSASLGRNEMVDGTVDTMLDEVEAHLRVLLAQIAQGTQSKAGPLLAQLDGVARNLETIWQRDRDAAVFVLMHRAVVGYRGYSVLHALQCALLVHVLAPTLHLSAAEVHALLQAALTMNVAMTALQDTLALQTQPPSDAQRAQIRRHPEEGARLLQGAGIEHPLTLVLVRQHHNDLPTVAAGQQRTPLERLIHLLQVLDRYTAAMSPRASRAGRDAADAARAAIVHNRVAGHDEVGVALLQALGLYPPGTFVLLESGETALVLRKGEKANQPVVATVLNKKGELVSEPRLYSAAQGGMGVQHAVSGSQIKTRINLGAMLKLLAYSRTPVAERSGVVSPWRVV